MATRDMKANAHPHTYCRVYQHVMECIEHEIPNINSVSDNNAKAILRKRVHVRADVDTQRALYATLIQWNASPTHSIFISLACVWVHMSRSACGSYGAQTQSKVMPKPLLLTACAWVCALCLVCVLYVSFKPVFVCSHDCGGIWFGNLQLSNVWTNSCVFTRSSQACFHRTFLALKSVCWVWELASLRWLGLQMNPALTF